MADDYLPDDPVFLLKVGEAYRLRITLIKDQKFSVPIRGVQRIQISAQDGDTKTLGMVEETVNSSKHEVSALLEPLELGSRKLLKASPSAGRLHVKYVRLNIAIHFFMNENDGHALQLNHKIYCRMVSPRSKMIVPKTFRMLRNGWEYLPQIMREGARASVAFAKLAVEIK